MAGCKCKRKYRSGPRWRDAFDDERSAHARTKRALAVARKALRGVPDLFAVRGSDCELTRYIDKALRAIRRIQRGR